MTLPDTTAAAYWDGLAVAVAPDRLLVGPEAAALTAAALERLARADGVRLSPAAEQLRRVARQVAAYGTRGHGDVPEPEEPAGCEVWISTAQAARTLGLSARQVRRIADQGDLGQTRKTPARLLVSADEVAALAAERSTA